jgi:hypothetical protein
VARHAEFEGGANRHKAVGFTHEQRHYAFLGSLGQFWEPPREGLRIVNTTDEGILVYGVHSGRENPLAHTVPMIPPKTSFQTDLPCGAGELIARTGDGSFVARRGPFDECNLEDWFIRARSA